jgi:hypothetical protein
MFARCAGRAGAALRLRGFADFTDISMSIGRKALGL